MSKRSKTVLIVAITYCLIFAGLLITGLYVISAEGTKLETTITQISEYAAKETAYTKMMDLLESTKENRTTLEQFFITENDTISFLTGIETAAKKIGVELKTNELAVVPAVTKDGVTVPAVLMINFSFTGQEGAVKKFLVLLEHVPYQTVMPKISLGNNGLDGVWTGVVQLRLTLHL